MASIMNRLFLCTLLTSFLFYNKAFPFKNIPRVSSPLKLSTEVIDEKITEDRVINITPAAMQHLHDLKMKQGREKDLLMRMGVRAGGCSGMSYVMDIIKSEDIKEDDHIEDYEGIKCAVDPKSLLFLYGLQLDYSDELIGGGFKFSNPNAETSCGCGKSFGV
mmetsp:Transcript_10679/g.10747  ORF Transcript_10679/g.10747 Transcript_10679/m.10747 type:complete len:162 (-) Transcript_10679:149-634(-)